MDTRIVFITGANTGIGYETVKALIQSKNQTYHIFMGSRELPKAYAARDKLEVLLRPSSSTVEVIQIDVTNDVSIKDAVKYVEDKFGWLDILINNAGVAFDAAFDQDGPNLRAIFNNTYDINVTGAQVTTYLFAPLLIKSPYPRLLFFSSNNANLSAAFENFIPTWAPIPEAGWPKHGLVTYQGYKCSKAALNMCMLIWHQLLKEDGVKTFAISPGLLATNLGGHTPEKMRKMGAEDAALGGKLVRSVVEGERDSDVGRVITRDGIQDW